MEPPPHSSDPASENDKLNLLHIHILNQKCSQIQGLTKELERKSEENSNLEKTNRQLTDQIAQIQNELHSQKMRASELKNQFENEQKLRLKSEQRIIKFRKDILAAINSCECENTVDNLPEGVQMCQDKELPALSNDPLSGPTIEVVTHIQENHPKPMLEVQQNLKRKPEERLENEPDLKRMQTQGNKSPEEEDAEEKTCLNSKQVNEIKIPNEFELPPNPLANTKIPSEVQMLPTPSPCLIVCPVKIEASSPINSQSVVVPTLPPLVFQIQSAKIKMGMFIAGEPQLLKNEFGSYATPFVVGVTPEGQLEYGNGVHVNNSNSSKCFWITDHLIKCGSDGWSSNILLGAGESQTITVEFLIAVVLTNLKNHVEAKMKGTCGVAVVTVPFHYSSTQRIQVKDGARLAGFAEVYLINEASASVFASPARANNLAFSQNILVLSENPGQIDAFIYSFNSFTSGSKRLFMIAHTTHSKEMDKKLIKSEEDDDDERKIIVQKLCTEALQKMQDKKYNTVGATSPPVELIILAESNKWKVILEQVGKQFVDPIFPIENVDDVIFGAANLSRDPPQIAKIIADKLAYDVVAKIDGERSNLSVIPKEDMLPSAKPKIANQSLPFQCKEASLFQTVLDRQIEIVRVNFHTSISSNQRFVLKIGVTNEGIIELKDVAISSTSRNMEKMEKTTENEYSWQTPNMSQMQFTKAKAILESVVKQGVSDEDRVKEAKQALLKMCNELKEQVEGGSFSNKPKLIGDTFMKTIQSAITKAEKSDITTEEIHSQMNILGKWRAKYMK